MHNYEMYRRLPPTHEAMRIVARENDETLKYLDKELFKAVFAETQLSVKKYQQHLSNLPPEPGPDERYYYRWTFHSSEDASYMTYDRSLNRDGKGSQVIFDGRQGIQPESMSLSQDEKWLVYYDALMPTPQGSIWIHNLERGYTQRVYMNALSGVDRNIVQVVFAGLQSNKSPILYWVEACPQGRPFIVFRCTVDVESGQANDTEVIYQNKDRTIHVDIARSKGGQYVMVNARSLENNEVFLIGAQDDHNEIIRVEHDIPNLINYVEVAGNGSDVFMVGPSDKTQELAVWKRNIEDIVGFRSTKASKPFVAASLNHIIFDVDIFRDFLVIYERSTVNGMDRIRLVDLWSGDESIVPLQEELMASATVMPIGNLCYRSQFIRFTVQSPIQLPRVMEYNVTTRSLTDLCPSSKEHCVEDIEQQRVLICSKDGSLVPLTLIQKISSKDAPSRPKVILMGYGSYGESMDMSYNPSLQPLLHRGHILAFAHIRGGSELGQKWHEQGKRDGKIKVVEDFICCAKALHTYLVPESPIVAKGFSAGGLAIGCAINKEPSLFDKAVITNGFLDVSETLKRKEIHLTQHEWAEFGNPLDTDSKVESYCPVATLHPDVVEDFPKLLLISFLDDDRVPFYNSLIYGLKVSDYKQHNSNATVHMHFEAKGGHDLNDSRQKIAALETTFMLQATSRGRKDRQELARVP